MVDKIESVVFSYSKCFKMFLICFPYKNLKYVLFVYTISS